MDAGRRHKTLRSENKDFITYRRANYMNISIFESVPFASKSQRNDIDWPDECLYTS